MGEIWDIYDVDKQLTGRTMKRNDWNMKDGDYHLTVLGIIKRPDTIHHCAARGIDYDAPWLQKLDVRRI